MKSKTQTVRTIAVAAALVASGLVGFAASSLQVFDYAVSYFAPKEFDYSERFVVLEFPNGGVQNFLPTGSDDMYNTIAEKLLVLPSNIFVSRSGFFGHRAEVQLPEPLCSSGWECSSVNYRVHFFGVTNTGNRPIPSIEVRGPTFGVPADDPFFDAELANLQLVTKKDFVEGDQFTTCLAPHIHPVYGALGPSEDSSVCEISPSGQTVYQANRPLLPGETILFITGLEAKLANYSNVEDFETDRPEVINLVATQTMWPREISVDGDEAVPVRKPDSIGSIVAPFISEKG